jgi:hypothetical protein
MTETILGTKFCILATVRFIPEAVEEGTDKHSLIPVYFSALPQVAVSKLYIRF